ncbi:spore coat U domain-containing protein [Amylibacter sp.]|nr:spore coat U domain-containing protein [Amylibacter sp.]
MKIKYKQKNIKFGIVSAIALGFIGLSSASFASESANLSVKASVASSCSISTSELDFGTYDPSSSSAKTGTGGSVTYNCTNGTAGTVRIAGGLNQDPDSPGTDAAPNRRMRNGGSYLNYTLYQPTPDVIWGNTAGSGVALNGSGSAINIPIAGAIPAGQPSTAGSYTDTVAITLFY